MFDNMSLIVHTYFIETNKRKTEMSNMSYCRFENTAADFDDCVIVVLDSIENGESVDLSQTKQRSAVDLFMQALDIVQEIADAIGKDVENLHDDDLRAFFDGSVE